MMQQCMNQCYLFSTTVNEKPKINDNDDCSRTSTMSTDILGKDFRPKRIILLRHGESLGNIDESAYVHTADWRIPLTPKGVEQASKAGESLRQMLGNDERVFFYNSPYTRTKQTLEEINKAIDYNNIILSKREEPRLSEQQFGNFQNVEDVLSAKLERRRFGRFYYRFPSGEAGLDVYSRISSFITTFVRDCHRYAQSGEDLNKLNAVIVTHGLSIQLFLMRWFQFSVEQFEQIRNPQNAQMIILEKKIGVNGHKWYELEEESRKALHLPESCGVPQNVTLHSLQKEA